VLSSSSRPNWAHTAHHLTLQSWSSFLEFDRSYVPPLVSRFLDSFVTVVLVLNMLVIPVK
jgi:hypothetical protein